MATVNTSTVIQSVNLASQVLSHPAIPGMSAGYWIKALPGSYTDKDDDEVIPYRFNEQLPITPGLESLPMNGSFEIITETWDGVVREYHNSSVSHIGPNINEVTGLTEEDAMFFAHLGTIRSAQDDTPFYWDRLLQNEGEDWSYFQYHQHNPDAYENDFSNGRITFTDGKFISDADPHYGYLIYTETTSGMTEYQSVLARIHQPSVGGAHSSHLDVILPANTVQNHIIGGMHKGSSNRYHAFYIAADSTQWKVYSRTYVLSTRTFTAEVSLGTYDLADPIYVNNTNIAEYPFRASCGELIADKLYIPVIYNNPSSGYDLKIWEITSADTLAAGTIVVSTIQTGVTIKPDCHLIVVSNELYAVVGESDGVSLYRFDGAEWIDEGQIVTNGSGSNPLRVHGISYRASERRFYTILSGDKDVTGTYQGQGVYGFQINFTRQIYPHFDFDVANNAFILRPAGTIGYVQYELESQTWRRINEEEPDPIPTGNAVFQYDLASPQFYKKKSTAGVGGGEYFYDVLALNDGRMVFCGKIEENEGNLGFDDFMVTIYNGDEEQGGGDYYCAGGPGQDYFTGMQLRANTNLIYLTGYTKSQLIDLKETRVHPFVRTTYYNDANTIYRGVAVDSNGLVVTVGSSADDKLVLTKFTANLEIDWTKTLENSSIDSGFAVTIDSTDSIYVGGSTTEGSGKAGLYAKFLSNGQPVWTRTIDTSGDQQIESIKASGEYLYLGLKETNNSYIVKLETNGVQVWQKKVPDFQLKQVTVDSSNNVYAAGNNKVFKLTSSGSLVWARESSTINYNSLAVDAGGNVIAVGANTTPNATIIKFDSIGTQQWVQSVNIDSQFTGVTVDNENYIYAVGYENQISRIEHHMMSEVKNRGFIFGFDQSGTSLWKNWLKYFNPSMDVYDTNFLGCTMDHLNDNIYVCGTNFAQDPFFQENGLLTRFWRKGFGTGVCHLDLDITFNFLYDTYPQESFAGTASPVGIAPSITNSTLAITTPSHTVGSIETIQQSIFDGSSGLWNFVLAVFDLDKAQQHMNDPEHAEHRDYLPMYDSEAFTKFYVVGTVGDSIADDGNIFGYDLVQYSDNVFYFICQTSGDVGKKNTGGSGVYDGLIIRFDESKPAGREFEFYQTGTNLDEEYYAITKLEDGNVAVCGRTTSNIGGTQYGVYDILVSILDTTSNTFKHNQIGGDGDDKAVNLHDIGGGQIALVYQTTDNLTPIITTSAGADDIGVVIYNYRSNTFNVAYQTGTVSSEILDTNGRVSTFLPESNTVVIVGSTAGVVSGVGTSVGGSDLLVAICDLNTGNFARYQTGTTGGDIGSCCALDGDNILIGGYTDASWTSPEDGFYIHFDAGKTLKATRTVD
jgi:hypothetical protein